jgi:phosphate:Na+ symporter
MSSYLQIIMTGVGGLGIFLLGMKYMSEGMQTLAGPRLRRLISSVTDNRVLAVLIGTFVTCLIQSSSITTVMVVGFVNSGFMTLLQALGVIFGANIGTTITGWVLSLKISHLGLPTLGLAALVFLFAGRERLRYWGMFLMGIGMVFFGLELMSDGFRPLRSDPSILRLFHSLQADSFAGMMRAALIGLVVTAIIQSSSATLGIVISLLKTDLLDFTTAASIVLGLNIGTTITAWLASIGGNAHARRAALGHILFNVLGVAWIIPLFPRYLQFIEWLVPNHGEEAAQLLQTSLTRVAMVHTMFNVLNTVVFLPLLKPFARLITWLIPDRQAGEAYRLEYLNVRFLAHPALGIEQSHKEIVAMSEHVLQMTTALDTVLSLPYPERDTRAEDEIFRREKVLDNIQREVTVFLSRLLSDSVPGEVMEVGRRQLRLAHEYESLGDYLMALVKLNIKLVQNRLELPAEERRHLKELHVLVTGLLKQLHRPLVEETIPDPSLMVEFQPDAAKVIKVMKDFRHEHLETFARQSHNPLMSLVYTDMLTAFRRLRDHAFNVAEVLAGEK